MRQAFYDRLEGIARCDRSVHLLTANLGFKFFDRLRSTCPEQFLDVGVAEGNMISLAAGMSVCGKNVYCYSIIPFLTMRAYEQIRIDICYHNLNVKLVGMGAGFTYGLEGYTHFGIEDIALMRALSGMHIVAPDTVENAVKIAELSPSYPSPLYIRLGRAGIHSEKKWPLIDRIGKALVLSEGKDLALIANGNMVPVCDAAAKCLRREGIGVSLINMHTIRPFDVEMVRQCASAHPFIVTAEEHSVIGGLGSAVAEVLAEASYAGRFMRIGIPEKLDAVIGDADYLWDHYGLSAEKIYRRLVGILKTESEGMIGAKQR
jgi:transketolase